VIGCEVAVLGDGSMGTTLAQVVAASGRSARLWCRSGSTSSSINERRRHDRMFPNAELAPTLSATTDLEEAVRGAPLVICAVPSQSFHGLAKQLGPLVTRDQVLLSATKGIDLRSLRRMSELLQLETGARAVGAISGPNITPEIMAGQLTAIVLASSDHEATAASARVLQTDRLRVYANDDLVGVELVGALKNVVAVAVGIATGLDLALNTRSLLMTRGIAEICHLAVNMGADERTFWGLGGIGDLYLTCTSPQSMNREVGVRLGRGEKLATILGDMKEVPESVYTVRACRALARARGLMLPITEATCRIFEGDLDPADLEETLAGGHELYDIDSDPQTPRESTLRVA